MKKSILKIKQQSGLIILKSVDQLKQLKGGITIPVTDNDASSDEPAG